MFPPLSIFIFSIDRMDPSKYKGKCNYYARTDWCKLMEGSTLDADEVDQESIGHVNFNHS